MNIVIPMAGLGQRFIDAGFIIPKSLIKIGDKPMYQHAVNSLPLHLASKLIFLIKENAFSQLLIEDIKKNYSSIADYIIVLLKEGTRGQAETVLKSKEFIDKKSPILIHNCDTKIGDDLDWYQFMKVKSDGSLVLFNSNEKKFSYAKLNDEETMVIDIQEKNIISNHASSGTYFFNDTDYFFESISLVIEKDWKSNSEYYLSTVFNLIINEKKIITPFWTKNLLCFGTPIDLVESFNKMLLSNKV